MATASSVIFRSLRMIGDKTLGDSLTSTEQIHYLQDLNSMLDSWSIERLMVYSIVEESFGLTASQGTYTIGTGGDFATVRPTKIVDPCFIRDTSDFDSPVTLINHEAYGHIVQKNTDGTYPEYLYYDAGFSATSTATIKLYPEPIAALTLFINSWKTIQSFPSISTTVLLPPGYQLAIESNFAIHCAAGFRAVPSEVVKIATESKAAIKNINAPAPVLQMDIGIVGAGFGNILTGP